MEPDLLKLNIFWKLMSTIVVALRTKGMYTKMTFHSLWTETRQVIYVDSQSFAFCQILDQFAIFNKRAPTQKLARNLSKDMRLADQFLVRNTRITFLAVFERGKAKIRPPGSPQATPITWMWVSVTNSVAEADMDVGLPTRGGTVCRDQALPERMKRCGWRM